MVENLIILLIAAALIIVAIVILVLIVRTFKKNVRQQNSAQPKKTGLGDDNTDLLELLAFYRQQYHQRQIPLEVYEAHEREIAAKLKEKHERATD